MQRPPQDSKKHPGDHAHQRSSDLKRPTDGGGPGGKIPRMDRTYSGSSSHSGGRPSGSGDSYDPRRSSSFSHSDRTGTSSKERSRDGYVFILQARVVQTLDCAIHRINHSLADKYWGNQLCYPPFEQLGQGSVRRLVLLTAKRKESGLGFA